MLLICFTRYKKGIKIAEADMSFYVTLIHSPPFKVCSFFTSEQTFLWHALISMSQSPVSRQKPPILKVPQNPFPSNHSECNELRLDLYFQYVSFRVRAISDHWRADWFQQSKLSGVGIFERMRLCDGFYLHFKFLCVTRGNGPSAPPSVSEQTHGHQL